MHPKREGAAADHLSRTPWRGRAVRRARLLLGLLLLLGCSASIGSPSAPTSESPSGSDVAGRPSQISLPEAQLLADRWLLSVGPEQASILDDRHVSNDEYVNAVGDAAACLNEQGFETGAVREVPDGVRRDFTVQQGDHSDADTAAAWRRCWSQHLNAIESVFLAQHARPGDASAVEQELLACLVDNELLNAPSGMTDFELFTFLRSSDASTAAWFCRERWLIARGEIGADPPNE